MSVLESIKYGTISHIHLLIAPPFLSSLSIKLRRDHSHQQTLKILVETVDTVDTVDIIVI